MTTPPSLFLPLYDEDCINLTTFRKNSEPVSTPVWFAVDQGSGLIYVETPRTTGKVKRIRHIPKVTLTPCTYSGKPRGKTLEGHARLVTTTQEIFIAKGALHRKYGLARQLLYSVQEIVRLIRRTPAHHLAYLAIEPIVINPQ